MMCSDGIEVNVVDMVNHPPHYETNGIECIDAMRASQGDNATKHFCICNAFKYIWRHNRKGFALQDLEKAVWYLNKAIEIEKDRLKTIANEVSSNANTNAR